MTDRERNLCNLTRPREQGGAGISAEAALSLQRLARSLHSLAESACNGELSPAQSAREARLERTAQEIAEREGWSLYLQGDPRGAPLYLVMPAQNTPGTYNQGHAVTSR